MDYIKNLQSRIALQEEKLSDSVKNLESLMQLKSRYEFLLETEKDTVKSLNERIHDLTKELEICNEKYGNISADLEQCSTQLKDYSNEIQISKNSLSQAEQQTNRLQAEIAWRDTKIYRLEDELEEIKSSISKGSGIQDGKPSLQRVS